MDTDQTQMGQLVHGDIAQRIMGAAFEVHRVLGYGFLEKVYQRALQTEIVERGSKAVTEHPLRVWDKRWTAGEYFADLLVDGVVIVEIKVAREYRSEDEVQSLNELKATGMRAGLLIDFGRERVDDKW